ncbi:MAG TPA: tetratricopeptide repeat protein [Gemmatimonadaceae bacterium]|nr:tetratricopeptide repeat protein [Gemmatimonadaceae bacterium]
MADEIRLWSDELARDPSSVVFIPLAEALRRQGQFDVAWKIVVRGIERHPQNAEARDLLARIHADRGDLEGAYEEWNMLLALVPGHLAALKGMAFVRFQQGSFGDAERLLREAHALEGGSELAHAIETVRRTSASVPAPAAPDAAEPSVSNDPRLLFADLLGEQQSAMLLDADGLVLAGAHLAADGTDVAQDVGASLSGVSDEAFRATRHLGIGAWRSIVFETEAAVVALAPAPASDAVDGLLVLAAGPSTPLGLLRRMLERCLHRVTLWQSVRRA